MKQLGFYSKILIAFCLLSGCSDSEEPAQAALDRSQLKESAATVLGSGESVEHCQYVSAKRQLRDVMKRKGWREGYDRTKGRILVCGSHAEDADFRSINEAVRQGVLKNAINRATAEIAELISAEIRVDELDGPAHAETESKSDNKSTKKITGLIKMSLSGIVPLAVVESYDAASRWYEVAVCVSWSPGQEKDFRAASIGEIIKSHKPGKCSVRQWVENQSCMLGTRRMVDEVGDSWLLGSVTIDDSIRKYLEEWALKTAEAKLFMGGVVGDGNDVYMQKAYVMASISRMLSCSVDAKKVCSSLMVANDDGTFESEERYDEEIEVRALIGACVENDRVKWFRRRVTNPLTGKEIDQLVGAVRCNDITAIVKNDGKMRELKSSEN